MQYDLNEHRHRFAVWAAARSAQRNSTSVARLREERNMFVSTAAHRTLDASAFRERLSLPRQLSIGNHVFVARTGESAVRKVG